MELFAVNRYDTVEKSHDPDREKRILEKLQKNIDKKKHKLKKDKPAAAESEAIVEPEPAVEHVVEPIVESPITDDAVPTEAAAAAAAPAEAVQPEVLTDFQVLGTDKFRNKRRIDMVLPPWLARPTVIANDLSSDAVRRTSVDSVPYLSDNLKQALRASGIGELFPVQEAVIPWIVDVHGQPDPFRPRDICVSAPTGSGKTLAYAVPIVQVLQNRLQRRIRALVVLPVNELAVQVLKQFRKLCEGTTLTCALLSKSVPFETEQAQLVEQYAGEWFSRADIVITTTGRLVEHLHSTPGFCLRSLQFLVMDEADRIMEQIQNNWLYHLDAHVKEQSDAFLQGRAVPLSFAELANVSARQPHKLLFSATLSQDPEKLQKLQLFQPKLFTAIVKSFDGPESGSAPAEDAQRGDFVGKYTTPAGLTEKYCMTQAELKPLTLFSLISENGWKRWLCFTNSGEAAHRLSFVLQKLFGAEAKVEELSSGLSPAVRKSVLAKFQAGQVNGLVCSDALARGIDVPDVEVVVSYEMPRHVKTYVHRVGRTARAGRQGMAVTILLKHELASFENLLKDAGKPSLNELCVSSNTEELKAKEFSGVIQQLQIAIKREQQVKMLKQMNEKQAAQKTNQQHGLLNQLQTQLDDCSNDLAEPNLPESWKHKNQQNIKDRRERKGISQSKKRKHEQTGEKGEGDQSGAVAKPVGDKKSDNASEPAKKKRFIKSSSK